MLIKNYILDIRQQDNYTFYKIQDSTGQIADIEQAAVMKFNIIVSLVPRRLPTWEKYELPYYIEASTASYYLNGIIFDDAAFHIKTQPIIKDFVPKQYPSYSKAMFHCFLMNWHHNNQLNSVVL